MPERRNVGQHMLVCGQEVKCMPVAVLRIVTNGNFHCLVTGLKALPRNVFHHHPVRDGVIFKIMSLLWIQVAIDPGNFRQRTCIGPVSALLQINLRRLGNNG